MNGLKPPAIEAIVMDGGLNQISPSLALKAGVMRQCLNFEVSPTGGYTRVAGYERYDGHSSPTGKVDSGSYQLIQMVSFTNIPAVGTSLTTSGGAGGVVAYISGLIMVIAKVTGTWTAGHTVTAGATPIGTIDTPQASLPTADQIALAKKAVADIYRADISAVPGTGPVRGVFFYSGVVYAFRDDTNALYADLYKSSSSGWTKVNYYKTVSFTGGGATAPADGATLTQGAVTATIKRVVHQSGSWAANSAAGQFIITTPSGGGGNFAAGAATIGGVNVTLAGVQTSVTMSAGGTFTTKEYNFYGQANTSRVYGADGVNKGFEFDGDVLVPIATGASTDKPSTVECHKGYLVFSQGSSIMLSAPGLPYDFTALAGAAEIAVGFAITDLIVMPGNQTTASLGVTGRDNTAILYGTSASDWNLIVYNTGTGSAPRTAQNMAQTYAFDDRGLNALQTSLQYGNFTQTSLTAPVLPFITSKIGKVCCATLCRRKSQYRVFFDDGEALYATIVNNKFIGATVVAFPDAINCSFEGKDSTGADVIFCGSSTGMVYQMEKGTSFDGASIPFYFALNVSNARQPRTLKRYRKAAVEVTGEQQVYAVFDVGYSLGYGSQEYSQGADGSYSCSTGGALWDNGLTWDSGVVWDAASLTPVEVELDGTAENIAFAIRGDYGHINPFTVNTILIHYSPRRMMR